MSNSTLLRSEMYDRLCNSDRRGFLKGAAGVIARNRGGKPVRGSIAAIRKRICRACLMDSRSRRSRPRAQPSM